MITIFTPTYNRLHFLLRLYKSLINQTSKNFIWLIIDDGSTDNTEIEVIKWIREDHFEINYYKQPNQGKAIAHNKGAEMAKTELFVCVDSDDFLVADAIKKILNFWMKNKKEDLVGILAYKKHSDGRPLTIMKSSCIRSTLKKAYSEYHLRGDAMLIYRVDIIKQYKFPWFYGEKFVPEAYLYDLIDQKGQLLILKEALYCCEYLEDGYTKNIAEVILKNPKGYLAYIRQRLSFDKKIKEKFLDTIRYTSLCIAVNEKKYIQKSIYPFITILTFPLAYLLYIKKYK